MVSQSVAVCRLPICQVNSNDDDDDDGVGVQCESLSCCRTSPRCSNPFSFSFP